MDTLKALNDRFAIDGHVVFDAGRGDLARAVVRNRLGEAEVYLHGAHVVSFRPAGAEAVLWTSPAAEFRAGAAIRGGIPVVFPWFGPHPDDPAKPQHGFARTAGWRVTATAALEDGRTAVHFRLDDDERTRALWPHAFRAELCAVVGAVLEVSLSVANTGTEPAAVGAALHTYLSVGDIAGVSIGGFDGLAYADRIDGAVHRQRGILCVDREVDRVYSGTSGVCTVDDGRSGRRIVLTQSGSRSTVVWNPWAEKARALRDFPDDGYRRMVCVEAVNTGDDTPVVPPGGSHTLSQAVTLA